ncbi:MAG: hypothetical protein GX335_06530, partial [Firmicutes bacterium]|nr:hypothetical protein [Bacillota bacterium]
MLNLVKQNPFRVLGITANASYDDILTAIREIGAAKKLGTIYKGIWSGEERLGPTQRTLPAVNAAATALEDPERRVYARLLWYHSHPQNFIAYVIE